MSEPAVFATLEEACGYLNAKGYQVSVSKLSRDHRLRGRVNRDAAGHFTASALDAYGRAHCKLVTGETSDQRLARLQREKLEEEVRKLRAGAERGEVELAKFKGALVERARVEQELAARAAVLRADFETWCHEAAVEIGARPDWNVAELQEWMVEAGQDWFERYADDREFVAVVGE